jgi:hypothetical protein
MNHSNERPPSLNGSPSETSFLAGEASENAPKARVEQAKINLLVDDIVDTTGWLVDQLNVLPAQRVAGDVTGMIYTLRRARAYWKAISGSAAELVSVEGERLSAIRQADGGQ